MVKILLNIDDYIYRSEDKFFFDASTSEGMLNRYLRVFEEINVTARVIPLNNTVIGYHPVSGKEGLNIVSLPYFSKYKVLGKLLKINKLLRKSLKDIDLAVIRIPSVTGFIILKKLRKMHIPFALEVVSDPSFVLNKSKRPLRRLVSYYFTRELKYNIKHAIGVSYVTERFLQSKFPPNELSIQTSYSSIELPEEYYYSAKKFEEKSEYYIIHVAFKITSPSKGHDILLKATKIVIEAGFNVKVLIVGSGDYISTLEELAKELGILQNVEFLGYCGKLEVKNLLRKSDLMIFPSYSEGLPRTIIEACASGLPCIASNVGGIPEILTKDVVFNPSDITGIAGKAIEILSTPSYYERLSKDNFSKSKEYSKIYLERKRDKFYSQLKESLNNAK
ncbi:MAG: glycosyltransferase family 4 protein [Bacteroidia bacterium]|nr:glycosyltransferase family 4 protein [Bacteroidia bacterium]